MRPEVLLYLCVMSAICSGVYCPCAMPCTWLTAVFVIFSVEAIGAVIGALVGSFTAATRDGSTRGGLAVGVWPTCWFMYAWVSVTIWFVWSSKEPRVGSKLGGYVPPAISPFSGAASC